MPSREALEMLREGMLQQRADQDIGPLIEAMMGQFNQRFAGAPTAMHVPEYQNIGDGLPASQARAFGDDMSGAKIMPIPGNVAPPDPNARLGTLQPKGWGGGGYENKTPMSIEDLIKSGATPGLEDFLSPGME
jgi:hypothetical protein